MCAARTIRLDKIASRLEVLEGYLVAYLNLDRVIEIIRTEDEPKAVMMAEFGLNDVQVEAILNMRLRALRKLGGDRAARRTRRPVGRNAKGFRRCWTARPRNGRASRTS